MPSKPARYWLLGFGCLMLGNAVYNLKDIDILPDTIFTRSSMHWGTVLEALILSFALANRLNFYEKEKEQIELGITKEKHNFLKELLLRQEQEKKRVAMELHDNIGQQLILIKNKSWKLQRQSEESLKSSVNIFIDHVAEIMAEIRNVLHRLRPYQMDLLGLTESVNGLISDTFTNYDIEMRQIDDINPLFDANESMHIFRIIQLLSNDIIKSSDFNGISYAITQHPRNVRFTFDVNCANLFLHALNDINDRLELLYGSIELNTSYSKTLITINIPYYAVLIGSNNQR